jgi:energy-coupling factor transporter transmembrane protein EcfT
MTLVDEPAQAQVGTLGRLAIFIGLVGCSIQMEILGLALMLVVLLLVGMATFRPALRRVLHWRWLLFFAVLVAPNALWNGDTDSTLAGLAYSSAGLHAGLLMALRASIMLTAVMWFTASVDISEVAGLLERAGLRGLGFSMGVAVNLLPSLQQSFRNAWHTLRMRGGIGRLRLRTARLLLITVFANALRRADEITLVAEARAFTPECSRCMPLKKGRFDLLLGLGTVASLALLALRG